MDEKRLAEIGRWPWGRDVIADLVSRISSGGPTAIGVDVLFTEREDREADDRLAVALRKAGNVVLSAAFFVPKGKADIPSPSDVPESLFDAAFMDVRTVQGIPWKKFATRILITEFTYEAIRPIADAGKIGHLEMLEADTVTVRGKEVPVNVYALSSDPGFDPAHERHPDAVRSAGLARGVRLHHEIDRGLLQAVVRSTVPTSILRFSLRYNHFIPVHHRRRVGVTSTG